MDSTNKDRQNLIDKVQKLLAKAAHLNKCVPDPQNTPLRLT